MLDVISQLLTEDECSAFSFLFIFFGSYTALWWWLSTCCKLNNNAILLLCAVLCTINPFIILYYTFNSNSLSLYNKIYLFLYKYKNMCTRCVYPTTQYLRCHLALYSTSLATLACTFLHSCGERHNCATGNDVSLGFKDVFGI